MMKKSICGVLVFCLFLVSGYAKTPVKTEAKIDEIAAVVNSDVITKSELQEKVALFERQLKKSGSAKIDTATIQKQVLDNLINTLLQMQLAKRNNIHVGDAELDGAVTNIAKANKITIEQLKQSLQKDQNISFSEFREQIRDQMLLSMVEQQFLGKDIVVSEEEIAAVLRHPPKVANAPTEYHVLDILIEMPDKVSPKQLKDANGVSAKIIAKLHSGNNIEQIIQEQKKAGKVVQDNDLGWRDINSLPAIFAKEVIKMEPEQIVGPLQAPNGLHVIKLLEVQGLPSQDAQFTREKAQEIVYRQKMERRLKSWLEELRATAYIKINN